MTVKYIFRIDDIAPNMNWNKYFIVKDFLIKYKVNPIIGVIPENRDENLKKFPHCDFDFWNEIKSVQKMGWEIALHGYQHVYQTKHAGILGVNKYSEFAGLPFYAQLEKLKKGLAIFEKNEIKTNVFMAPAHSFDNLTLKALKTIGLNMVTDGYANFPYSINGITFVPQLFSKPRKMFFGIYTFCIHLNDMPFEQISYLEEFLYLYSDKFINFSAGSQFIINGTLAKLEYQILKYTFLMGRKIRKLII